MEKRIVAFTYMVMQLAKNYAENSLGLIPENLDSVIDSDKLKAFNIKNDFNKEKCMLFPFLITIGNGKKNELLDFFEVFYPLKDGFIHKGIREKADEIPFFKFDKDRLLITDDMINLIGVNPISVEFVMSLLKYEEDPKDVISYIDKSIYNINKLIPAFMNKYYEYLSEWSKNNDVYRDYSSFFGEDEKFFTDDKEIESMVMGLIKNDIQNTIFELEPEKSPA